MWRPELTLIKGHKSLRLLVRSWVANTAQARPVYHDPTQPALHSILSMRHRAAKAAPMHPALLRWYGRSFAYSIRRQFALQRMAERLLRRSFGWLREMLGCWKSCAELFDLSRQRGAIGIEVFASQLSRWTVAAVQCLLQRWQRTALVETLRVVHEAKVALISKCSSQLRACDWLCSASFRASEIHIRRLVWSWHAQMLRGVTLNLQRTLMSSNELHRERSGDQRHLRCYCSSDTLHCTILRRTTHQCTTTLHCTLHGTARRFRSDFDVTDTLRSHTILYALAV